MASGNTIKEFLVALGFKIDEAGLKKFETSIGRATKLATGLGAAMAATAVTISAAVVKITAQFDDLYYASQRTQSTVKNIVSLQYAYTQIGLTSDKARSGIEGVARALRSNPGYAAILRGLGIESSGKDPAVVTRQLFDKLAKMPFFLAQQYGAMFGIDGDDLVLILKNLDKLDAATADLQKRQKEAGVDTDGLASKSNKFSVALRRLVSDIDIFSQAVVQKLVEPATWLVERLSELVEGFNRLNVSMNGWASVGLTIATTAMAGWIAKAILMRTLLRGLAAESAAAAGGAAAGAGGAATAAVGRSALARLFGATGIGTFLTTLLWADPTNEGEDELARQKRYGQGTGGGTGGGRGPIGIRNNNPGNLRSWGDAPQEGGFAKFPTALAGISAMTRQLMIYSERGYNTISSIVSKWAPPSENNTGAYISDVAGKTGFGPDQPLNLKDPAVMRRLIDAIISHENGQNPYDDATKNAAINARLGIPSVALAPSPGAGGDVRIDQKTEINVSGVNDPERAASSVAGAQSRVNGDLVRNTRGAVR